MRDTKKASTSGHVFKRIHKGSGPARLIGQILENSDTNTGKSAQTLGNMITNLRMGLAMHCQGCGHEWRPAASDLLEEFGEDAALSDIRKPCPHCQSAHVFAHPVSL